MLVKILNVCVGLFLGIGITGFAIAGFAPEVVEDIFTVTWFSVSLGLLMLILLSGAVTNMLRIHHKEKQVRFVHFRNGVLITIFGLLFFEWKNGWRVISSFF
ncbi:hypothetical protein [Salibacterium qingdaonense]|uniref:Uncharacterized protein n=1 Tax=Salibacterium qingdaonense TaxID=266892 RepID=A0A1I4LVW0_9BACI|nr:hypothetical protein [Salibacterium qingdaonense]SFL95161.1 hypothetical protein SAMN04488054_10926 [Salibacterium qingdaonense]